ncbi:transcription elongation factor, mitochondrial-like isoform X1 [Rhagoletis pomonella]|uniref:transcription elongation factor, mitochondrial-like isoform X1 n=1 Tax=Rhagoletis pomonella TaxID=28610 RepID=UPI001784A932|nr:transcription elongation factor, mitochondrial-like isoform X1 [Rhagoletis pomonella]
MFFTISPLSQSIRNVAKPQLYLATISTTSAFKTEAEVSQVDVVLQQSTGKTGFPSYTLEQQRKILAIVNNDNQEILNYDIAKTRAAKLATWKKRHGPLKNIEDILLIEGFGTKIVEKFYRSMLEGKCDESSASRSARQRTAGFITPAIDAEHRSEIRSCVSIRIGVSSVTWARLELPTTECSNEPCNLTHWEHHEITEKKLHLCDLVQRLLYIDYLIPKADCYLFENPQMAQVSSNPGSVDQQNISIQKSQVSAIMAYTLCARGKFVEALKSGKENIGENEKKSVDMRPNVFYLRRFLTARLFSQLIGTERVSSEETMLHMMRTHNNVNDLFEDEVKGLAKDQSLPPQGNVYFPVALREMFSRSGRYQREFLGQSLLLNLAFVRLVLLQDKNSIAAVTRNQN